MQILNQVQIQRKVKRLALQIAENNLTTSKLYIGGINRNGQRFASLLIDALSSVSDLKLTNFQITLSPANPVEGEVGFDLDASVLNDQHVLIVDDVANTGRTLFYAFKELMNILPKRVEVAVLVDREHKSFPVKVDYVGLSLSTTLQDDIDVRLDDEYSAHLQ